MGLLDDAIREHLDLKRRRGADPVEIERAEQEALGPVRRAPEGAEDDQLAPEAAPDQAEEYEYDEEYGYEDEPEPPYAEDAPTRHFSYEEEPEDEAAPHYSYEEEPAPGYSYEDEPEPPYEEAPVDPGAHRSSEEPAHHTFDEHLPPVEGEDEPRGAADSAAPVPPSHTEAPPPHTPAPGSDPGRSRPSEETAEYEVGHEPAGDEMLEETPEFLQDTPEHDRLWFEQRPPRDFDFED